MLCGEWKNSEISSKIRVFFSNQMEKHLLITTLRQPAEPTTPVPPWFREHSIFDNSGDLSPENGSEHCGSCILSQLQHLRPNAINENWEINYFIEILWQNFSYRKLMLKKQNLFWIPCWTDTAITIATKTINKYRFCAIFLLIFLYGNLYVFSSICFSIK